MSSEQINKRRRNQSAILHYLHSHGPTRRMALSEATGIRKNSVTDIVKELLGAGVLQEDPPGSMRSTVSLAPEGIFAGTAVISSERVLFSLVDCAGIIHGTHQVSLTPALGSPQLSEVMVHGFNDLLSGHSKRIAALGIACPGVVDSSTGTVIKSVNLDINSPWNIRHSFAASRYRVIVENDMRAELWSYVWFGDTGSDAENLLYIGLGEGLGAATVTRGTLNLGQRLLAGEIGHIKAGSQGRRCSCGKIDCLECYCSARAILTRLQTIPGARIKTIDDIVGNGHNPEVKAVLDEAARCLCGVLAGATAVIDPQAVILGTPKQALAQLLAPKVETHLNRELAGLVKQGIPCRPWEDVETAALKGMAGLVFKHAFLHLDFSQETL